jgi:hypothetical protein
VYPGQVRDRADDPPVADVEIDELAVAEMRDE